MRVSLYEDVLLIDWKTAGALPQPFEQSFRCVVVLKSPGAEIREYEELGPSKYAIHTEIIEGGSPSEDGFLRAFKASYQNDGDVRRAVRLALKAA